jgi:hypothetical protein
MPLNYTSRGNQLVKKAGAPRSSPCGERHSNRLIDFAHNIIVVGAIIAI